jgi:Kef-type K+ transport system membrane component KefB
MLLLCFLLCLLACSMLKDLKDMETLSELGVLFLLYEQGLELSLDRLKVGTSLLCHLLGMWCDCSSPLCM